MWCILLRQSRCLVINMYMNFNLVKCCFAFLIVCVLVTGLLLILSESELPVTIVWMIRFGKFSYVGKKTFVNHLEVSKCWFRHFYVVATLYSLMILYLLVNAYVLMKQTPDIFITLLDLVGSSHRKATVDATTMCLATSLLCLQVWIRLYEYYHISVFSDSKVNALHYIIGICHYLGSFTAIIMEAPGFTRPLYNYSPTTLLFHNIGVRGIIGSVIFLWAWYNQLQSAIILGNLRRNKKGEVVSYEHKIPKGGLFKRLSAPHMFCKMLMYLALLIILWGNLTWSYVFAWVFFNQLQNSLLNHGWYQSNFKDYLKECKAYLPFIL